MRGRAFADPTARPRQKRIFAQNCNVFSFFATVQDMIPTVVWGTGNVGRAAIRAVDAHPALKLVAVLVYNPDKVGRDAGELAGLERELGVTATDDIEAVLAMRPQAVVYAASGEIR